MLVTAAPGVGKSRLRSELVSQLATRSEPVAVWELERLVHAEALHANGDHPAALAAIAAG